MRKITIGVERSIARRDVGLFVFSKLEDGTRAYAENATMKRLEPNVAIDPLFSLTDDEAQDLFESLWAAGFRPAKDGTSGQLAATQSHLEDMRRLAFKALQIDQPKS